MGKSKAPSIKQVPTMTPEQQALLNELLGSLSERFQQGGFDITEQAPFQAGQEALMSLLEGFNPEQTTAAYQAQIAQPAIQQFREEIAPAIQERGTAAGFRQSGDVQRDLARAGTQLESNLAGGLQGQLAQREQFGQQNKLAALSQALGFAGAPQAAQIKEYAPILQALGLSPFAIQQTQGQASPWASFLGPVAAGVGGGIGGMFGRLF